MQVSPGSKFLPDLSLTPCQAPWWASSGHAQTILGYLLSSPTFENSGERFEVELSDGDRLVSYITPGSSEFVVSLFHGLSGDIQGNYMHRTALLCEKLGHTIVRVNHRGAGEGHGLAKEPYHSGRREDVGRVIEKLREKYPHKKHISVGFSMSGNILLYLLSGQQAGQDTNIYPDAAIAVNGAIDLQGASEKLFQGLNRIYDLNFVHGLRASIIAKQKIGSAPPEIKIPRWARVYDLDDLYTAKVCGFGSRENYYRTCSAKDHLQNIQIPTYVLTAKDDPFIDVEAYKKARWSPKTSLYISDCGGHLGYLTKNKTPLGTHRWLDYYLHEALQSLTKILSRA